MCLANVHVNPQIRIAYCVYLHGTQQMYVCMYILSDLLTTGTMVI